MNKTLFKKIIIVVASVLVVAGVSLFAYWMSVLNEPEPVDEDITVIIGVGEGTNASLKVTETIINLGLNFVPEDRLPNDIIDDEYTSEFVFEVIISWIYSPEDENEKGALLANMNKFIFYDQSPFVEENEHQRQLTEQEQETLKESFLLELVKKDNDGTYHKPEGHYLINPNQNEQDTQKIYLRLKFIEDVTDHEIWNLLVNKIFALEVTLTLDQTVITP